MSDQHLRDAERRVAQGELDAEEQLKVEWRRHGLCVCCGSSARVLPTPPKRSITHRILRWAARIEDPPPPDPLCEDCARIMSLIDTSMVFHAAQAAMTLEHEQLKVSVRDLMRVAGSLLKKP